MAKDGNDIDNAGESMRRSAKGGDDLDNPADTQRRSSRAKVEYRFEWMKRLVETVFPAKNSF